MVYFVFFVVKYSLVSSENRYALARWINPHNLTERNLMNHKTNAIQYILAYVCWAVTVVLGVLILNLERETIVLSMTLSAASLTDKTDAFYKSLQVGAVSQWSWLFIGLITLVMLVGFEHMYRNAVPAGSLWRIFFMVTAIELTILFLIHTIFIFLNRPYRPLTWVSLAILLGEALLAILFFVLYSVWRRKSTHE